jgi:hypothetical protein
LHRKSSVVVVVVVVVAVIVAAVVVVVIVVIVVVVIEEEFGGLRELPLAATRLKSLLAFNSSPLPPTQMQEHGRADPRLVLQDIIASSSPHPPYPQPPPRVIWETGTHPFEVSCRNSPARTIT